MSRRSASGYGRRGRPAGPAAALLALAAILAAILAAAAPALAAGPAASKSNPWQAGGMSAEEQELQKKVREIALTLRAPCCPELTLAQHDSPQTLAIKREIRDMLKEGKGRGEIVSTLRARYGNAITGGIVASSWRPILIIGGSVLGLVVILLVARWMMFHEKEPMHLDEGHWMEEQAEKGPGGESFKKAS